jgi:hypothetical protein
LVLLGVREIFSPILYWYAWHIFETDLQMPLSGAYQELFDVRIYCGQSAIDTVKPILLSFGEISPSGIDSRSAKGDAVGIAFARDDKAVGYSWITFVAGRELAFETSWRIHSNEALLYGSYVLPEWRGRGVHGCLDVAMNAHARQRGLMRTVGSMSVLNTGALSLAKCSHKKKIMTVMLVRFRGLRWTYRKSIGAPFRSRFETTAPPRITVEGQIFRPTTDDKIYAITTESIHRTPLDRD